MTLLEMLKKAEDAALAFIDAARNLGISTMAAQYYELGRADGALALVLDLKPEAQSLARQLDDAREQAEEWKRLVVGLTKADPTYQTIYFDRRQCFFCDERSPVHAMDCAWPRARGKL